MLLRQNERVTMLDGKHFLVQIALDAPWFHSKRADAATGYFSRMDLGVRR